MKRKDNIFTANALLSVPSSTFDLGHDVKFTTNLGVLTPSCVMEAVPGDHFRLKFVHLVRFAPLVAPVMHRMKVKTEYFFVPNRILFPDSWEDFITGVEDVEAPVFLIDGTLDNIGALSDYYGIPPGDYSETPLKVSAFPFAAYFKIYDDWYRDQNLQTEEFIELEPGDNTGAYNTKVFSNGPLPRAWEHDYFTSALPYTQQGVSDVAIPLTFQDDIPVVYNNPSHNPGLIRRAANDALIAAASPLSVEAGPSPLASSLHADNAGGGTLLPSVYDPNGSLTVDVQSDAATLNDLREAWALQSFLETTIRGGARYFEQLWSHFHVKSPDARLQRAEFIGRDIATVTISEVLATAQSSNDGVDAEIAVGSMAGHGISVGGGFMDYYCEEHGWIIGLVSVVPDSAYSQGIHRHFFKFDRFDYPWPAFANLGEQAIQNKEIFAPDALAWDKEATFGYLPRYSEYRYQPSRIAGQFRPGGGYDFWTLGRVFDPLTPPVLDAQFIRCDPSNRIFAVTDETVHKLLVQTINAHSVNRKLPRYGIPAPLT